jgi:hypothetical protein
VRQGDGGQSEIDSLEGDTCRYAYLGASCAPQVTSWTRVPVQWPLVAPAGRPVSLVASMRW